MDGRPGVRRRQPRAADSPARPRRPQSEHRPRPLRPQRLHLRQHQRRHRQLRPRAVLEDEERRRARRGRDPREGRVGRCEGHPPRPRARQRPAQPAQRPDGGHARQGRGADRQPRPRAPVPYQRQPRARDLADVGRRARLHRLVRGVPREDLPDVDGRRLRDPRGRRDERGHVRRAGPVLGDRACPDAQVRGQQAEAGPDARRHADDGRVPAPVPGPRQPEAPGRRRQSRLRRRLPRRDKGQPRRAARGIHPHRLPGGGRGADARPVAPRQEPDDVRRVRPWVRAPVPRHRREQAARRSRTSSSGRRSSRTAGSPCRRRPPPTPGSPPTSRRQRRAGPAGRCRST